MKEERRKTKQTLIHYGPAGQITGAVSVMTTLVVTTVATMDVKMDIAGASVTDFVEFLATAKSVLIAKSGAGWTLHVKFTRIVLSTGTIPVTALVLFSLKKRCC